MTFARFYYVFEVTDEMQELNPITIKLLMK
ncbi:hypothetical protein EMIT07CA2_30428 [Brevibacillus sp. IT-7CA2]